MHRHLYFVCPTDHLEPVINNASKNNNYYYTSLGNSVVFNSDIVSQVEQLIRKNHIGEISFVLSNDNSIIHDALRYQKHPYISGLELLYFDIAKQKEQSETFWQTKHSFSILSYYLNHKIRELQLELHNLFPYPKKINGKIYNRQKNSFEDIYSNLICVDKYILN